MSTMTNAKYCFICFLSLCFVSCNRYDVQLKSALEEAEENRKELEKVLKYYENDEEKKEAAKFLIRNMPVHFSSVDNHLENYYNTVDSILINTLCSPTEMKDTLDRLSIYFPESYDKVPDVKLMKADYLIGHIEEAFRQWKSGEWAVHLSFEEFCEFLLPYKSEELQPFDNWREDLKFFGKELDKLSYCDLYRNSAIWATQTVNATLRDSLHPCVLEYHIPEIHRLSTKLRMPFGLCKDYVQIAVSVLRSNGIPVAIDFTPQWPFRSLGHSWNVVLANSGKWIPFGGVESDPGEPHKLDEKMAKVYRRTYSINPDVMKLIQTEKRVPSVFQSPCLKDVTAEYMKGCDVEVEINASGYKYAYLAVFDNQNWIPVAYGKIKNGKAIFKDMGRDILYLPVCFNKQGIKPVGFPFILTERGHINPVGIDENGTQEMTLFRKFPVFSHVQEVAGRVIGAKFQAANRADFADSITLHRINKWGTRGEIIEIPPLSKPYRYWRYYQPEPNTYCNIAEIDFFERDSCESLRGLIIGTDSSCFNNPNTRKEAAFDGNILTSFDAPTPSGAWVGMDFGHPVDIGKIIYTPRGDGNTIEQGDLYELFYWEKDHWVSAGQQIAQTVKLHFKQVPSGQLYWLRNLTKGVEERIFTYIKGEQIFW